MATGLTFVSYSRTDSDFAVKLASDLRAKGADVWLDQLDIEAGSRWDTAVEGALGRSARLLVLLTPKSVASQNVLDEVSYALDEGKTVLPVLVEACAIPMRMRRLQHVDFTRGYEAGVARLLDDTRRDAAVRVHSTPRRRHRRLLHRHARHPHRNQPPRSSASPRHRRSRTCSDRRRRTAAEACRSCPSPPVSCCSSQPSRGSRSARPR